MHPIRIVLAAGIAALLASSAHAGVLPPSSNSLGRSLEDWQLTYWTSTLTGGPAYDGRVLLMPLPDATFNPSTANFEGQLYIEYAPGTPFFLPIFTFVGESYVQMVPDDDPADYAFLFLDNPGLSVLITIDGVPIIDSSTDDITRFYAGTVYFDPEITDGYPRNVEPGLDAAAAIWVQGLAFVQDPLPPGPHTLHLLVDTGLGFGFDNTWSILVRPAGSL
jgi:hypothetical protein